MPFGCLFYGFQSHEYPPEKILYLASGKNCNEGIPIIRKKAQSSEKKKTAKKKKSTHPKSREVDKKWLA